MANTPTRRPRVLVAGEFSGTVRDAFRAAGCEAWSCDLLDTEVPGPHLQADANFVLRYPLRAIAGMPAWMIRGEWDCLVAHPPCTFLANSGVRWLYKQAGPVGRDGSGVRLFPHAAGRPHPPDRGGESRDALPRAGTDRTRAGL